jgi:hypothetical protein
MLLRFGSIHCGLSPLHIRETEQATTPFAGTKTTPI